MINTNFTVRYTFIKKINKSVGRFYWVADYIVWFFPNYVFSCFF